MIPIEETGDRSLPFDSAQISKGAIHKGNRNKQIAE